MRFMKKSSLSTGINICLPNKHSLSNLSFFRKNLNIRSSITYRAKDAIADFFMEKTGKRPSVRLNNADLILNLHIAHNTCTLSLDSSGESLHKRGYRVAQTEAPINEVLAAGLILKSGWKGEKNFIDPMCGSGTILIEAALIATNTAPGIYRKDFAFDGGTITMKSF